MPWGSQKTFHYMSRQWAAMRTCCLVMSVPPQVNLPLRKIAAYNQQIRILMISLIFLLLLDMDDLLVSPKFHQRFLKDFFFSCKEIPIELVMIGQIYSWNCQ